MFVIFAVEVVIVLLVYVTDYRSSRGCMVQLIRERGMHACTRGIVCGVGVIGERAWGWGCGGVVCPPLLVVYLPTITLLCMYTGFF